VLKIHDEEDGLLKVTPRRESDKSQSLKFEGRFEYSEAEKPIDKS
jgi:hypothetical protein